MTNFKVNNNYCSLQPKSVSLQSCGGTIVCLNMLSVLKTCENAAIKHPTTFNGPRTDLQNCKCNIIFGYNDLSTPFGVRLLSALCSVKFKIFNKLSKFFLTIISVPEIQVIFPGTQPRLLFLLIVILACPKLLCLKKTTIRYLSSEQNLLSTS